MLARKSKKRITNKTKLLLISIVFPLYSIGQQHFTLKVHFDDPSVKTLYIGEAYYYKLKTCFATIIKCDSSIVNNNTYLFEGTILYPTAVRLYPMNTVKMNKLIFIDTGYQEISIMKRDSSFVVKANTGIEKERTKFINEMGTETIDDKIDGERLLSYVRKNPDSYVALFAIINQTFRYSYLPIFEKINNAFGEKIKHTKAYKYYLDLYSHITENLSGKDYLGTNLLGKRIIFSEVKGKDFVLLDFWASWCVPCRQMMPHLKDLYQKYHSKGLEIISIASSLNDNKNDWKKALREEGRQSWINLFSEGPYTNGPDLGIRYGVTKLPTTILINKQGAVIGRYVGYSKEAFKSDLDKKLSEIFK